MLRLPAERLRQVESLHDDALDAVRTLLDQDLVGNVVLAARIERLGTIEPGALGGAVLGIRDADGRLAAAVFSGGNLLPLGGGDADLRALAGVVVRRRRTCTSIVGRSAAVLAMWEVLRPQWGPARLVRKRQPLLVAESAPPLLPSRFVRGRRMTDADLDAYLPAAVAMFREELDLPPLTARVAEEYRRRVAALIRAGHAFGVLDAHGTVVFKADIGSVSAGTCQVQGVWTHPDLRGRGLATAALPGVIAHGLELAPTVSLYVNDFNEPARRLYARLGMREVGSFSTVLF
jgi:predicted GNAT family acetyltransferase